MEVKLISSVTRKCNSQELPWRRRKRRDVKTLSLKEPKQRMAIPGVIPWGFHAISNKLLSSYSECFKLPTNRFKGNAWKCLRFTTCSLLTNYLPVLIHLRAQLQPQNAYTNQLNNKPTVESLLIHCPRTSSKSIVVLSGIDFVSSKLNTFTAIVDLSRFNNSCLKSPASSLVDLTFQSHALRSFSLNQLRNLSL